MRITDERVEQVLPPNIKNSDLSDLEKRTLAALLHSLTISKGAQESGFLVIGNKKLFSVIGGRREYIMTALRTLEEYDLFKRVVGKSRVEGEKSEASEYHFNWDNIFKNPLKKKTSEELFSKFFKSLETPMGTPITIPITTTITTSTTTTTLNTIETKTSTEIPTTNNNSNSNNNYFNEFTQMVNRTLVGKNEDELIQRKAEISKELESKRMQLGSSLVARCNLYLKRKYDEALVLV